MLYGLVGKRCLSFRVYPDLAEVLGNLQCRFRQYLRRAGLSSDDADGMADLFIHSVQPALEHYWCTLPPWLLLGHLREALRPIRRAGFVLVRIDCKVCPFCSFTCGLLPATVLGCVACCMGCVLSTDHCITLLLDLAISAPRAYFPGDTTVGVICDTDLVTVDRFSDAHRIIALGRTFVGTFALICELKCHSQVICMSLQDSAKAARAHPYRVSEIRAIVTRGALRKYLRRWLLDSPPPNALVAGSIRGASNTAMVCASFCDHNYGQPVDFQLANFSRMDGGACISDVMDWQAGSRATFDA